MPLFCSICRNLLVIQTTATSFNFKCEKCEHVEESNESDTLRYEDVSGTNLIIYKDILLNAGRDQVNPKVVRKCKCGSNFARQVRLGNELKLINTCVSCGEQWLDGTRASDNPDVAGSGEKKEPNSPKKDVKSPKSAKKGSKTGSADVKSPKKDVKSPKSAKSPKKEPKSPKANTETESKESTNLNFVPLELSKPPQHDNAYVWFMCKGSSYLTGILTSIYSVKKHNPDADLVVMVTDDIDDASKTKLLTLATHLFYIPYLSFPGKFNLMPKAQKKYSNWIDISFSKWNMLALPYKKAFLLDADVIAVQPLDEIWHISTPAAVFPQGMPKHDKKYYPTQRRNAAGYMLEGEVISPKQVSLLLSTPKMFVAAASSILLAPNLDDYQLFIKSMESLEPKSIPNETGCDEQAITYFISNIKKQNWHTLSQRWNSVPWIQQYQSAEPLIHHFMSVEKPWDMPADKYPDLKMWHDMNNERLAK